MTKPSPEHHLDMGERLTVDAAILRLRRMGEAEGAYAPAGPSPAASCSGCGGPSTRAKITHWFCQMGESFDLAGHTVGLAANFLDRCTARRECGAAQYQLIAVTALLLAAKVEERKPITLNDLVVNLDLTVNLELQVFHYQLSKP